MRVWIKTAAMVSAVASQTQFASAQDAIADFYKGRVISIYVGLPAGGSYDTYARLIGAYLPKHLPGNPTIIIQNMPGGGSLRAANYVYNIAPQDGTAVGAMSSNVPLQQLVDDSAVKYDTTKINWLPCPTGTTNLLVVRSGSPVKTFDDLLTHETQLGTLAPGSGPTLAIGIYKYVLGAKVKAVLGYEGLPSVMLAMERGEVDGYSTVPFDTLQRAYGTQWKAGKLRVIAQSGEKRLDELSDIPTTLELAKTDDDRKLIGFINASGLITFPYMMGPGVPKDRVEAMRTAMMQIFADAEFLRDAAARQTAINPVSADRVTSIIQTAFATPEPLLQRLRKIADLKD
jgi:tripartite-type tricarboxylate transporter receptor subunit TctC